MALFLSFVALQYLSSWASELSYVVPSKSELRVSSGLSYMVPSKSELRVSCGLSYMVPSKSELCVSCGLSYVALLMSFVALQYPSSGAPELSYVAL